MARGQSAELDRKKLLADPVMVTTIVLLIAIAVCMMIIGRGHTIYFDNKTLEYEGTKYEAVRRINVNVNGEQVAKLSKKERGMATFTGQKFSFDIEIIREKNGPSEMRTFNIEVPYTMDGIVVNLIGMIEGLPQDAWMSEFVPVATEETEEEPAEGDEFDTGLEDFDVGGDI